MKQLTNNRGGGYRDFSIDVLKGLAIILVVYGHTWPFCRNFIYLFHMAVFLMASGYCYSAKFASFIEWKKYVVKKIKGLYIPYVITNGSFTLLAGLFLRAGVYTDNPEFLSITSAWPVTQSLYNYYGFVGSLKRLVLILLFIEPTQLGTATWFLTSLFLILIFHSLLTLLLRRCPERMKTIIFGLLLIVILLIAQYISVLHPVWSFAIKCFPCTYSAFLVGAGIRKIQWKHIYSWWMGLASFAILIVMSMFFNIEVSSGRIVNIAVFVIASLCGWILLKSISEKICCLGGAKKAFIYIGQHTMPILCLHVISFKMISWFFIKVTGASGLLLAGFHVIFDAGEIWKLMYTIVGVGIPLLLYWVYRNLVTAKA